MMHLRKNNFGGLLIENPSPFHYYKFKLPPLFRLLKDSQISKNITTTTLEIGSFIDLASFPILKNINENVELGMSYNKNSIPFECDLEKFYISIGELVKHQSVNEAKELDELFLSHSIAYCKNNPLYATMKQMKSTCNFIIWLGIGTFKRSWLEEVATYIIIIKEISKRYEHVGVVFDGWTSKHYVEKSEKSFSEDITQMNKIIESLPSNVKYLSTIGATPEEKVAVGSLTDFFIASHATASLWVSRVCKTVGITHISNVAREQAIRVHTHYNASLVPKEIVRDENLKDTDSFSISYHIGENDFLEFFREQLSKFEEERLIK
jgi:hypothetical protein